MNSSSLKRIRAMVRKEVWHILRDWQTLMIVLAMPILMMFLYGYALTLDIKELPVIIEDPSGSREARALAGSIDASSMFKVIGTVPATLDINSLFKTYKVKAIFRLPPDFARLIRNGGRPAQIQVLVDGTDPNIGTLVRNMVEPMVRSAVLKELGIDMPNLVTVHPRILYNPEQKSSLFFVPGLMAIILMLISAMLTSLTITREKERGTLEQLLVSPVRGREIILGKLIPYIFLAAMGGVMILVVGRILFDMPINGSLWFLALASIIYIITALSLGLIISNVAKNQQQAMMMVVPLTMLPTIILSGFIFPVKSMAIFLQILAHVLPATWFLILIRGIILKGVGIMELWQPLAALSLIGLVFFAVSVKKFSMKL